MGGRVNRHLCQRRLVALLREATGIDEVEPDRRPWTGATVRLETAIRTKSTQRISLQQQDDSPALSTFPAELKPQAKALYQTGRAQRLRRQLDRIAVGTFAGPSAPSASAPRSPAPSRPGHPHPARHRPAVQDLPAHPGHTPLTSGNTSPRCTPHT
jgi:hypothetical protein